MSHTSYSGTRFLKDADIHSCVIRRPPITPDWQEDATARPLLLVAPAVFYGITCPHQTADTTSESYYRLIVVV